MPFNPELKMFYRARNRGFINLKDMTSITGWFCVFVVVVVAVLAY